MSDRNGKGQYEKGHPGGPGRPPKARELAYLAVLREKLTLAEWGQIVEQTIRDAKSQDPIARDRARRFLAEYAIGKPAQTLHINPAGEGDTFAQYDDLSDEELRAIIAQAERGSRAADSRLARDKDD